MADAPTAEDGIVLVCGLGRLGQHCVRILKEFSVVIHGIEAQPRHHWALPQIPSLIDKMVIGDCRLAGVLEQAGIGRCRAILLVTGDERTNLAAALAARSLNPRVRVVLRSAQENLNALLTQTLGNFVAFEPTELAINAFTLAGLGDETAGLFSIDDLLIPVVRRTLSPGHRWQGRRLSEIDGHYGRILSCARDGSSFAGDFHHWDPEDTFSPGDVVTLIEANDGAPVLTAASQHRAARPESSAPSRSSAWAWLRQTLTPFRHKGNRMRRVTVISGGLLIGLYGIGALLFKLHYPTIGLRDALNVPVVLLLGGYDNLFGQLTLPFPIPIWLNLFSLGLTIAGTLFLGIVYATLTERVLSARFRLHKQRPPLPKADHIVVAGLGRVGRRVAGLMQRLGQPVVGLNENDLAPEELPDLPIVVGALRNGLKDANLPTARSLVSVTDDDVANLEIALEARIINPACRLVIRMDDPAFGGSAAELIPGARALGTYAFAAEAFAAAAFGENIHGLLQLDGTTVIVTEYTITADDTLVGRLLAEIVHGYGLVPILHQRAGRDRGEFLPSEDLEVLAGDRLIVLATTEGLRRVEMGQRRPPTCEVRVERALNQEGVFDATMILARVSGCEVPVARDLMSILPATLEKRLYRHQALRLVHELNLIGCRASVMPGAEALELPGSPEGVDTPAAKTVRVSSS